jgi:hypothetical protein
VARFIDLSQQISRLAACHRDRANHGQQPWRQYLRLMADYRAAGLWAGPMMARAARDAG